MEEIMLERANFIICRNKDRTEFRGEQAKIQFPFVDFSRQGWNTLFPKR